MAALNKIASYCFTSNIRNLASMDKTIDNLFKAGIVTEQAIDSHIEQITKDDNIIGDILASLGLIRLPNANDRMLLKTWIYDWNLSYELIKFACSKCAGQYMPMQYLNKLLATYHTNGVKTTDDANNVALPISTAPAAPAPNTKKPKARQYTKQQLDSLFVNLDEVEL